MCAPARSQVVVNYASGAARAEEVVAEVKAAGGEAVAIGGSVAKVRRAAPFAAQAVRRTLGPQPRLTCGARSPPRRAQRDEVAKLFSDTVAKYGKVDILVNNAGITRDTLLMRMKPEQWQEVIDTNLTGVFYCTQARLRHTTPLERVAAARGRRATRSAPLQAQRTRGTA